MMELLNTHRQEDHISNFAEYRNVDEDWRLMVMGILEREYEISKKEWIEYRCKLVSLNGIEIEN